jgi:hypothetical protein
LGKCAFGGVIIATDGAYIQCLKAGIIPDWVVTIDPHPTRIAVLFGADSQDDYFERTMSDHGFRQAQENKRLVDENHTKLVIGCSASESVVERTKDFNRYWFAPLVDDPTQEGSITRQIVEATSCVALNTGGTVGTGAWAFACQILKSKNIAVVGMDFGYYSGTPLEQTQEWNMLKHESDVHDFYPVVNGHWGVGFTSPTYAWYLQNFLDLLDGDKVVNCSGGGFLQGDNVHCCEIEEWINACGAWS